jgi:predicted RNA-binding Zn ribbon-like protein
MRPTHAREVIRDDALANAAAANTLLRAHLGEPVRPADLVTLRSVRAAVVAIVDALIDGAPPPLDALNAIAERVPAIHALRLEDDGALRPILRPKQASAAAEALLGIVRELSELDPSRLRRCARPECRLVFYDLTRSGTQRWHAERPCGLRERQRRHRVKQLHETGPPS